MIEISVTPFKTITTERIEEICVSMGLQQTMRGSLKSIAANTHWHFKNGKQKGVLEITLIHNTNEIILSVHQNRRGGWEGEMMKKLKACFINS